MSASLPRSEKSDSANENAHAKGSGSVKQEKEKGSERGSENENAIATAIGQADVTVIGRDDIVTSQTANLTAVDIATSATEDALAAGLDLATVSGVLAMMIGATVVMSEREAAHCATLQESEQMSTRE